MILVLFVTELILSGTWGVFPLTEAQAETNKNGLYGLLTDVRGVQAHFIGFGLCQCERTISVSHRTSMIPKQEHEGSASQRARSSGWHM